MTLKFIPHSKIHKGYLEWPGYEFREEGEKPKLTYPYNSKKDCPICRHLLESVFLYWYYCPFCGIHFGEVYHHRESKKNVGDLENDLEEKNWTSLKPFTPSKPLHFSRDATGKWKRTSFRCEFCGRVRPEVEHYVIENAERKHRWRNIYWHLAICTFCKDNRTIENDLTKKLSCQEKKVLKELGVKNM